MGKKEKYFKNLMSAHRISNGQSGLAQELLIKNRSAMIDYATNYIKNKYYKETEISLAMGRAIILKAPLMRNSVVLEKGIILLKFTNSFGVLFQKYDFNRISEDYYIVLEPSWAGYCLPEIIVWASLNNPVIIQATDSCDLNFLTLVSDNLNGIPIGSSNWVDDSYFYPISGTKKVYDVLYVTNYNRIKRHHIFFKAISKAVTVDPCFRAAIACGAAGSDREVIFDLMDYYEVKDFIDIYESINKEKLNELINSSYCNVLLSLKEGSNRSLFETMFSGVPVILHKNNVGVRKDYINSLTGLLADDDSLLSAIIWIKDHFDQFDPLKWAIENISPEITTENLVSVIRKIEANQQWGRSSEIFVKVNSPEAKYKGSVPKGDLSDASIILNSYSGQ
ncbi:glycosyltransferase [Marinobacter sp.]|uniref:glycosyltransferase n=1 Tax=Marinobacter sp. TaxID=50741 RepID=UPI003561C173